MKRKLVSITLSLMLVVASATYAVAASPLTTDEIKEGTVVIQENGYTISVTTTIIHENLDTFIKKLQANGSNVYRVGNLAGSESVDSQKSNPVWLQNNYFSGSGSAYNAASGKTGYISCKNGYIGLGFTSGQVSANLVASGSGVYSKPRMSLTTYGGVGGTSVVARDYVFTSNDYSAGTSTFNVNSYLTGVIAYYQMAVYGDFKAGNNYWTARANLVKK